MNSQTYLNIHTNAFGGGEVRAFLTPTPEPTTVASALSGFGGLWLIRRRLNQAGKPSFRDRAAQLRR